MKTAYKFIILGVCGMVALVGAVCIGSVAVSPLDILAVLAHKLFGVPLPAGLPPASVAVIWSLRLPRVLCAFAVGGALSVSGAVFQSVLGNPLASSYTLGVSSGASLGAAVVIMFGFLPLGVFTLPLTSFVFGLATVLAAIAFASRVDRGLKNNTIILVGMVFSLFVNAVLTLLNALRREYMQELLLWQMGSFVGKNYTQAAILWGVAIAGILVLLFFAREMDILTFGEEQSRAVGVETARVKLVLLVAASLLTGVAVCFTGVIGFVDLIAPHLVRRLFGPAHRVLLPASALFGGTFMVVADTLARTVMAPLELPVGAITALVGAPFFAWVYFSRRKSAASAALSKGV